jgi:RNA-directed DNA polymerase
MADPTVVHALARAFLAGETTVDDMVARGAQTLGRNWRWLRPLARRYVSGFSGELRPREREVVEFFLRDAGFRRAWKDHFEQLRIARWLLEPQRMQPAPAAENWNLPPIESVGALAEWFEITPGELLWFADLQGLLYKSKNSRLRHYHYRVLAKKSGSIRLIEAPKSRLKALQRKILSEILDKIPAHPAAHGFVPGRSVRSFIGPHQGKRVVLKMDLSDFFPSITGARIQTVYRMLGYPESVADLLGGLCANAVPRAVWKEATAEAERRLLYEAALVHTRPHLPQGAPTSPALANICAYRVDCRLSGLARSAGAEYTRYADDLAFSGGEEFERGSERFATHAAAILLEEGFAVNHRKTRIMRRGVRQRLTGLVGNEHANVLRADFDRLKATLHNCARLGAESQNRGGHPHFRAHLDGRVGWVEWINPAKGARLRRMFEQIAWQ